MTITMLKAINPTLAEKFENAFSKTDKTKALAEGLSTATSFAQVRNSAKAVLSDEGVVENE